MPQTVNPGRDWSWQRAAILREEIVGESPGDQRVDVSRLPGNPLHPEWVVAGASALGMPGVRADVHGDGGNVSLSLADRVARDRASDPGATRRGGSRAAEELTRQNDEAIAEWIRRIGDHSEAITDVLVHDLVLSDVVTRRDGQNV